MKPIIERQIRKEISKASKVAIKGYLAGALHDGTLTTGSRIKYFQRKKSWITHVIKPCLETVYDITFGPKALYWDKTKWVLHFGNQAIWKDLTNYRVQSLQDLNQDAIFPFIRAFWDTDGGCPRHPSSKRKLYIDFTQKEKSQLKVVREILNQYGIRTGEIRISERKLTGNIHRFAITGKPALLLFINTIGSWHPSKRPRLEKMRELIEASANAVK